MSVTILREGTMALLRRMHSRREMRLTGRKRLDGFWIFERSRVRTLHDFLLIARFPRGGRASEYARRKSDALAAEARRFEAEYGASS